MVTSTPASMDLTAIQNIISSTVQMVKLDPTSLEPLQGGEGAAAGSGAMINLHGHKLVLSVAHVALVPGITGVSTEKSTSVGTKVFALPPAEYIIRWDSRYPTPPDFAEHFLNRQPGFELTALGILDFCYFQTKQLDVSQRRIKKLAISSGKKKIITTDLADRPSVGVEYGFFGRVQPRQESSNEVNIMHVRMQEAFFGGVRFLRKAGLYNVYSIPIPCSVINFRGTSGAPIMDADGRIVSLITHGYPPVREMYGVDLEYPQFFLQQALGLL